MPATSLARLAPTLQPVFTAAPLARPAPALSRPTPTASPLDVFLPPSRSRATAQPAAHHGKRQGAVATVTVFVTTAVLPPSPTVTITGAGGVLTVTVFVTTPTDVQTQTETSIIPLPTTTVFTRVAPSETVIIQPAPATIIVPNDDAQRNCNPGDQNERESGVLRPTSVQVKTLYVIGIYLLAILIGWNFFGLRTLICASSGPKQH